MSDLRPDLNNPYGPMSHQYETRTFWSAIVMLALLVGGLVFASMYSSSDTQTAMTKPRAETTGSASPIPVMPPQ